MAKNKKDKDNKVVSLKDSLESHIIDNLNKRFGKKYGGEYASTLNGASITEITDYISTGSDILDLIISNKPGGGVPTGRLIEITGPESSGKSLVAAHMMANTQKRGGVAVYIDTESSTYKPFFKAIGVDLDNLVYVPAESVEDALESVEEIISTVRTSKDTSKLVTIVFDSVAAATTETELKADDKVSGYGMQKAKYLSTWLRNATRLIGKQKVCLVFINQLRDKIQAMAFADKNVAPGGRAIPFHASVRIRLSIIEKIKGRLTQKSLKDEPIGVTVEAEIKKNKIGPAYRKCKMNVYFASGIDNYDSWFNTIKDYEIYKRSGNKYEVPTETGEVELLWEDEIVDKLKTNDWFRKITYDTICDALVVPYTFEQAAADNAKYKEDLEVEFPSEEVEESVDDKDTNGK